MQCFVLSKGKAFTGTDEGTNAARRMPFISSSVLNSRLTEDIYRKKITELIKLFWQWV